MNYGMIVVAIYTSPDWWQEWVQVEIQYREEQKLHKRGKNRESKMSNLDGIRGVLSTPRVWKTTLQKDEKPPVSQASLPLNSNLYLATLNLTTQLLEESLYPCLLILLLIIWFLSQFMLILMSASAPVTCPLDSESSNIPTPLFTILSSSLSPMSQNERFEVNDAEEIMEVNAA